MNLSRFMSRARVAGSLAVLAVVSSASADVSLPNIFGSHMVLQRNQENPVWGWADAGEKLSVTLAGKTRTATADKDGNWRVKVQSLEAGGPYTITVEGKNKVVFDDVLVGEVWICSGQSNMGFNLNSAYYADTERLTAKYPNIRLISVPQVGTQEEQKNFDGKWEACAPETVGNFTAVGYFFGRLVHQATDIPVGLIDNAWGGSACEAWVRRDILEKDKRYADLIARWEETEKTYDHEKVMAQWKAQDDKWKEAAKKAQAEGKPAPNRPRVPTNPLTGQHRPGNLYAGVLKPTIGYGIRGVIWYQGESNSGRAYQYRHLFPLMIQEWRDEWGQGDFPFYWVQLADFMAETDEPGDSAWAELREAQTMTMDKLKNTGQAVIIDLGEGRDIHPRNKQEVGARLARWALAKDYGINIPYSSPTFKSMEIKGNKATLKFDNVGGGLFTFDVNEPVGFAVAGEDREFHWAKGKVIGQDTIQIWSDDVKQPVSVRYGWADNPKVNVYSREGLPLTPFRTDDWEGVTANVTR